LFPPDLLAALGAASVRWVDAAPGDALGAPDLRPEAQATDDDAPHE
jgi:hypothetical protein